MEGKNYTNINLKRALGKTGDYIAITMEAYVHNVEPIKDVGDKKVVNFTTFINNRGNYIKYYCGDCPQENADGGISVRVSMWDSPQLSTNGLASRFSKYMSNKSDKNVVINLTGSIKVKEEIGKDGRTYKNVYITADEFWEARVTEKRGNSASNNTQQQTAPVQPQQPQQAQPEEPNATPFIDGFISIDDDEELPF